MMTAAPVSSIGQAPVAFEQTAPGPITYAAPAATVSSCVAPQAAPQNVSYLPPIVAQQPPQPQVTYGQPMPVGEPMQMGQPMPVGQPMPMGQQVSYVPPQVVQAEPCMAP